MFIPPKKYIPEKKQPDISMGPIRLKSSHLLIDREIAEQIFGKDQNAYAVYYPNERSLLLASVNDDLFNKLHKASQHMLKDRNLKGDKSIAFHELLIDNQLDNTDRALEFNIEPALGILNIKI